MKAFIQETRPLAKWLLAQEGGGQSSGTCRAEATIVCEKLRKPLSVLCGVAGYRSLLSRAVALAKAEDGSLASVLVKEDGALQGLDMAEPQEQKDGCAAGEILVAHLLGLLIVFIGQPLTLHIVGDVWPDAPFGDS